MSEVIPVEGVLTSIDAGLLARINTLCAGAPSLQMKDGEAVQPPMVDLEALLNMTGWWALTPQTEAQLDRLRKKIEVARRLFRYYTPDLSRAAAPTLLSVEGVQRLCALLLRAAVLRHDARYLNSVLKLLDGVLGRGDLVFPSELRKLAHATLDVLAPLTPRAA
jgi:hypothetical protein